MGQKVHPHGLRVGVIKGWDSKWYADKKNFSDNLVEDYNLRKTLKAQLYTAVLRHPRRFQCRQVENFRRPHRQHPPGRL